MSNYEIGLLLVKVQTCSNVLYDSCDRPNEKCVDTSNGPRCKCENGYERCIGISLINNEDLKESITLSRRYLRSPLIIISYLENSLNVKGHMLYSPLAILLQLPLHRS
jgi:hypothetical protein